MSNGGPLERLHALPYGYWTRDERSLHFVAALAPA
jgi:hypothetical protein